MKLDIKETSKNSTIEKEFKKWVSTINELLGILKELEEANTDNYKNTNSFLSKAYDEMKKECKINWDEEKEGYVKEYGENPKNNLYVVWYIQNKYKEKEIQIYLERNLLKQIILKYIYLKKELENKKDTISLLGHRFNIENIDNIL